MKKRKNTNNFNIIAEIIIIIILIASFAYIDYKISYFELNSNYIDADLIFLVVMFLYVIYIAIHTILHEFGHAVAGLLTGYKFVSFRIGSFALIKKNYKYEFKKFKIRGTIGQCLMYFPDNKTDKIGYKFLNLNGGLVNLIIGTIFLVIGLTTKDNLFNFCLFQEFGIVGLVLGIQALIPCKFADFPNDGYNLMNLIKSSEARECFYIMLKINALFTTVDTFDELPKDMVKKLKEKDFSKLDLSNPIIANTYLFKVELFYITGEFEKTYELYKSIMNNESILKTFKNEAQCECLFFAIMNDDKKNIDKLYSKKLRKYIKSTSIYPERQRLMYAYYKFYKHDEQEALKYENELKKSINTFAIKANAIYESKIINNLKTRGTL